MNQPTLFGMVTPGMKLQFHGLPGPEHRLEVVKIRQGQAWLRKPCGATYVYPVTAYTMTQSGLYVPGSVAAKIRRPVAIDLFCGAGGFSVGFMQAGYEVIAGLDFDYHCMLTYLTNLGAYPCQIHWIDPEDEGRVNAKMERDTKRAAKESGGVLKPMMAGSGWIKDNPEIPGVSHYFYGDVRKITGQEVLDAIGMKRGEVDCVMGGPPCQGFSISGKREVMDPRNSLVFDFARLVLEIWPKTMIMENVPGIRSMVTPEGLPVLDAFCRILADGGFSTFDTLRQSLLQTAGAGAALRGESKAEKKEKEAMKQRTLFEEGEAS